MVGYAEEAHLLNLIVNQGRDDLRYLAQFDDDKKNNNNNGKPTFRDWTQRDDVYVYMNGDGRSPRDGLADAVGRWRSVRYGRRDFMFGPEVGFGWTMAEYYNNNNNDNDNSPTQKENVFMEESVDKNDDDDDATVKIVLVKIAWGGRSLAVDFRSPSSPKPREPYYVGIRENRTPLAFPSDYGQAYRDLVEHYAEIVGNKTYLAENLNIPQETGYELAGVVFWQGFNDVVDKQKVAEYESNLRNFIADLRQDLMDIESAFNDGIKQSPMSLPFVIGELGMAGLNPYNSTFQRSAEQHLTMRQIQATVANTTPHVRLAPTALYAYQPISKEEDMGQAYHYSKHADTYVKAGESMAHAMWKLLQSSS